MPGRLPAFDKSRSHEVGQADVNRSAELTSKPFKIHAGDEYHDSDGSVVQGQLGVQMIFLAVLCLIAKCRDVSNLCTGTSHQIADGDHWHEAMRRQALRLPL